MENQLSAFNYSVACRDKDEYVLTYGDAYYLVGSLVYRILLHAKSCTTVEQIRDRVDNPNISVEMLNNFINSSILPLFKKKMTKEEKFEFAESKSYWFKREIISNRFLKDFVRLISPLFGRLFFPLLILAVVANIVLYLNIPAIPYNFSIAGSAGIVVAIYFVFFAIMILHEMGHLAAAHRYGIDVKSINFAIYILFPIFYVDLNDAWKKSVRERTIINLGGIATQVAVNVVLLALVILVPEEFVFWVCIPLFWINNSTIAMNLIPFFKFDGYWIVSDLLGIPNLLKESNKWFKHFFVKPSPFNKDKGPDVKGWRRAVFMAFNITRFLFYAFFTFMTIAYLVYVIVHSFYLMGYMNHVALDGNLIRSMLPNLLLLTFATIVGVRYARIGMKTWKKHKQLH